MRSDWPFNFAFINSVGWRLYRGFVRPGTNERVRQPVMKCPWIEGSISLPSSCSFSSFLFSLLLSFSFSFFFFLSSLPRRRTTETLSHRSRLSFICIPGIECARNKCLIYCLWNVVEHFTLPSFSFLSLSLSFSRLFFTGNGKNSLAYAKYMGIPRGTRTFNKDIVACP